MIWRRGRFRFALWRSDYRVVAGIACFYSIHLIKQRLVIDDALDVFPVHGVSGILGAA